MLSCLYDRGDLFALRKSDLRQGVPAGPAVRVALRDRDCLAGPADLPGPGDPQARRLPRYLGAPEHLGFLAGRGVLGTLADRLAP